MDLQLRKAEKEQSNRVAITALERDGKLLMGLRGDTKKWGFPGGHLLQDESPLEGANRELFEETGLSPNGGEIQTVGDQFNETAGKHIHLFHGHCSDGEPTAVNDPDGEFQDFGWFGPEEIERLDLHIPPEQCIVHQMLLAEPMTKSEAPTWRSNQGLVIPASGTPQRIEFDANFLGHIVDLYAGGDIARIKKHLVQLSKIKTDKQPTSQDLVEFYTEMLQNGEEIPGLVVRRDDAGDLFLVDGINRYAALQSAGESKTWVYEILNDFAKSEETLAKTRPGPRFPKLGLPDDRRETEIVDRVGEWKKKFYIRAATVDLINRVVPKKERAKTQEHADENLIGDRMGMSAPAMRFGASPYAVTDSELGSKWGPSTPIATRNHENAHMLFGRVRKMYGKQARQNLAENIWHHVENRLGPEKSGILNQYLSVRYPEAQRNGLDHEERMATVLNLVNDPAERKNLLGNKTQDINLVADIGKQAHQAMLEGGRLADAHWLKDPEKFQKKYATGVFQKSEAEDFSIEDPTAWNSSYLHDDLHPLAHLESEFGTAIKPNRQDGAVGAVALKPKVAWEAYAKSPTLQKLFPGLDQVSFLQKLSEDHKLYNLVSSAVFAAAKAKHGTPEKAAFAWRYGNAIANRATDQQVLADPYVRQYSELLGNQLAEQPLNKSLEYVVNNTTGSTWKSSYGVDLVVSRDPHDRSQWRTTVLVKAEPVRHFVAKSHYDALLTAESLGADFGNPGHSLLKAGVPQPPSWIPDELKSNWKLAVERHGPEFFMRYAKEDASPAEQKVVSDTVKAAHWPKIEDVSKPEVKIPDDMFQTVFDPQDRDHRSWKRKLLKNPNITPEQIGQALQDTDSDIRRLAIRHPNATSAHVGQALQDEDSLVVSYALEHPDATSEHFGQAIRHPHWDVRSMIASDPRLTPEQLNHALSDENRHVRGAAIQNPNVTPEHISQAMKDDARGVRFKAIQHPRATAEHISQALKDEDQEVRAEALKHPNVTPEHISQALQDPDDDVRGAAIQNPNVTPEHIRQALGDENEEIRRTAMLHPNLDVDTAYPTKVQSALGTNKLRKLRDYLEQNGGSVNKKDIPSFPQQLGKLLDHRGNLTAAKVQQHIDSLPKTAFNVSESNWEGPQRHSNDDSKVFQLNLTSDHLKKMKESGVYDTYKKLNNASMRSSHPVTPHTIGWVRYTGDQPGVQIDEVQSDLGSHLGAQARAQAAQNGISEDEAEAHVNKEYPPEHLKKIKDILFQGKHPSELLHETFRQSLRDKGWHNTPIHVHDVETKLPLASQDPTKPAPAHMMVGYRQHPEKMGMEPSTYGKLETQSNPQLKGKKQWADVVRKSESLQKDDLQTKASPASPIATKDPQPRPQGPVHVDAVRHSLPGFLKHDEVHDLMHGLDLNQPRDHKTVGPGINQSQSYWMKGPKGKVYVKESTPTPDAHSDAQAEGAYHNVAKDFFGMGQYVPNVGAFEHPETGKHVAVVQSVDGEHHDIDNDNHEFNLHQIHKSGDLHKLALMNMLMQNADRHKYNYLLPKEGGLKLIDHGLGFSWSNEPDLPHYVKAAHGLPNYYAKNAGSKHFKANKNIDWNDPKNLGPEIHPEAAKWAMKLNPTELKNQIASHGIHPDVANESANRLKALQVFLTQHPKASITEAYRTPQSMTSQGAFNNSQVKTGK